MGLTTAERVRRIGSREFNSDKLDSLYLQRTNGQELELFYSEPVSAFIYYDEDGIECSVLFCNDDTILSTLYSKQRGALVHAVAKGIIHFKNGKETNIDCNFQEAKYVIIMKSGNLKVPYRSIYKVYEVDMTIPHRWEHYDEQFEEARRDLYSKEKNIQNTTVYDIKEDVVDVIPAKEELLPAI